LVELFASLAVFSFSMLGVYSLQSVLIQSQTLAGDTSLATNLAGSALEIWGITPFDDMGASTTYCWDRLGQSVTCGGATVYFTEASSFTAGPQDQYKDVAVTVSWNFTVYSGAGSAQNISLRGRVYPK
jgi:hypothetical protein